MTIFSPKIQGFHFKLWLRRPDPEESLIWSCFWHGVPNFKPQFLSPTWSKPKNFSAHLKEDYLRFSKITILLFLVSFCGELWPLKHGNILWGHPVFYVKITISWGCFWISSSSSFKCHHSQVCMMHTWVTGAVWTKVRLILANTVVKRTH